VASLEEEGEELEAKLSIVRGALRELIKALERYYAPGDSICEAYADSEEIQAAVRKAYEVLES